MKYTFKKHSGEEMEIDVIDNTFMYYDYKITAVITKETNPLLIECGFPESVNVFINNESEPIFKGCYDSDEDRWFVSYHEANSLNKNLFVCIAKLLSMIL